VPEETILVVDDGKDNREFLVEHVLKPNDFAYLTAKNGEEGLRLLQREKPDLILLDLQMPRMDGIDVLEAMHEHNLDIPVVLMTFHGSEEIAIEVYRMGVKDYVKKPYYPEEMLDAINRALTETRLRREKDALTERVLHANQQLTKRLHEFEVLYNIGKVVTSTMDLSRLLPQIVDAAVKITGAEEGYITLIQGDAKQQVLIRRAHKLPQLARAKAVKKRVRDNISQHVIKTSEALRLGPETLRKKHDNAPLSVACVPLQLSERTLGTLSVLNHNEDAGVFLSETLTLLNALSDYAAIAIENSRNYHALRTSKEKMRDTFERFVAPSVVQQALQDEVELGGERQEISILFADIRGYTSWSEDAPPEEVVEMLNHYLSVAGNTIIAWEGTLDKFFGDGLMAIFNAPNAQADHIHRAAEAAIAIQKAAKEINAEFGYDLSYSVGVNVGEAVVGYIGTSYAVNYTAIGDAVNLAKRLQEYAAPGQILIDETVYKHLGGQVQARAIGKIQVKGRKAPAYAYELIDLE
jgi:class 3 adenylate cyclase/DNA-binding response OmpR family regulator